MADLHPAVADAVPMEEGDTKKEGGEQEQEQQIQKMSSFASNPDSKPSFFSDEKGNLKFVNFICRYPTIVFFIMFFICIVSNMVLVRMVRQNGNPITEDSNE